MNKDRQFSRRRFLEIAAKFSVSAALPRGWRPSPSLNPTHIAPSNVDLSRPYPDAVSHNVPSFPGVTPPKEMQVRKDWDARKMKGRLQAAVVESSSTEKVVTVELPEGEIVIDKTIWCAIPADAKIRLQGHKNGTRLKLDPRLSNIPKEWGSFVEYSMFYFKDVEGELTIDGIEFDGGSERAKQRTGYKPPKSPWDSIIVAIGRGQGAPQVIGNEIGFRPGEKYNPAPELAGKRTGSVTITNCRFYNSESSGALLQNLGLAEMKNSQGSRLDCLFVAPWCDWVSGEDCVGEYFTSDGVYIINTKAVQLKHWQIKTSRQGYDLQGVDNAKLVMCNVYDAAYGFAFAKSEADVSTFSGHIQTIECGSSGCLTAYAVGGVQNLEVVGGLHAGLGDWCELWHQRDFHHYYGIVSNVPGMQEPFNPFPAKSAVFYVELDRKRRPMKENTQKYFRGVRMQVGEWAQSNYDHPYECVDIPGVVYLKTQP